MQLDPSVTSIDRLAEARSGIREHTAWAYERDVRTGLYVPADGFLGIHGLLPREVGTNIIGGINEATTPGWRSQVTHTQPSMYSSFVAAERRCIVGGRAPDLTILGTNAYRELVMCIQPQQRFMDIHAGIPMLRLHSGALFHDRFCETNTGYMMHSADFNFHASPFDIVVEVGIDGVIRVHVRRREQLIASRRFRSGTITPPPDYFVA